MSTTFAEGWYIDGERLDRWADVTSNNGVILENREGWDDAPGLRGADATLLGRHGSSWRRKRYEAAKRMLTLTVHGTDADGWTVPDSPRKQRAAYEEALDNLYRLFAPRHRLLDVERVHASGDRRRADCEVISPLTPAPIGMTAGRLTVELSVPGAFWEDVDALSHALGYDVSGPDEQELEVYSLAGQTAPCADAIIEVTGPCSSIAVHDTETGSGWTYADTVEDDETLTVDCGVFTALLGATSVITDLVLADQQLLEIVPATVGHRGPYLTVDAADVSAGFRVVVTSRRKWLR
jgi:hypothetical protein